MNSAPVFVITETQLEWLISLTFSLSILGIVVILALNVICAICEQTAKAIKQRRREKKEAIPS